MVSIGEINRKNFSETERKSQRSSRTQEEMFHADGRKSRKIISLKGDIYTLFAFQSERGYRAFIAPWIVLTICSSSITADVSNP